VLTESSFGILISFALDAAGRVAMFVIPEVFGFGEGLIRGLLITQGMGV